MYERTLFSGNGRCSLRGMASMHVISAPARVWVDDRHPVFRRGIASLLAADGFTVAGESAALDPVPDPGLLDVLVFRGPRSEAFTRLPKLYHGDYLPDPNVGEYKERTITLDAERPLPIQANGDVLGTTPATFELIRLPIRLKL